MVEHSLPRGASRRPDRPAADGAIEAVVQVGAREIRYRRAGRGSPVVLLHGAGADDPLDRHLFSVLAGSFRVIAPVPPADLLAGPAADSFSVWLRSFVDGLGLIRPGLVADGALGVALLGFVLTDPERVGPLAIVCREAAGEPACQGLLRSAGRDAGHRLLILHVMERQRTREEAADAAAELIRFLGEEGTAEVAPELA